MLKDVNLFRRKWLFLAVVTVVGFLADIGTKHLANTRLEYGKPVNVIGEYFQWLLVYNKGAVFGTSLDIQIPGVPTYAVFIAFMSAAIAFLLLYYRSVKDDETLMRVGLALVLPGAFGNLHDRVVHREQGVVDFIRMGFPPDSYWFIYNVADVFVTVGVSLMVLNFLVEAVGIRKSNSLDSNSTSNSNSNSLNSYEDGERVR